MNKEKTCITIMGIGILVAVLGLFIAVTSTFNVVRFNNLKEEGAVTAIKALVTDMETERVKRTRKTVYYYTYTFEYSVDGETYTGEYTDQRSSIPFSFEDDFDIYYYNDNPEDYFLEKSVQTINLWYWVTPVVGVAAFIVAGKIKNSPYY